MDWIMFVCLSITHLVAYSMGKADGERKPCEDAYIEVEKYDIDKRYEHQRWLEERKYKHDE